MWWFWVEYTLRTRRRSPVGTEGLLSGLSAEVRSWRGGCGRRRCCARAYGLEKHARAEVGNTITIIRSWQYSLCRVFCRWPLSIESSQSSLSGSGPGTGAAKEMAGGGRYGTPRTIDLPTKENE